MSEYRRKRIYRWTWYWEETWIFVLFLIYFSIYIIFDNIIFDFLFYTFSYNARMKQTAPSHIFADNRKARFDYEVIEEFEAGLQLYGEEVKSIRKWSVNLPRILYPHHSRTSLHRRHAHIWVSRWHEKTRTEAWTWSPHEQKRNITIWDEDQGDVSDTRTDRDLLKGQSHKSQGRSRTWTQKMGKEKCPERTRSRSWNCKNI